MTVPPSRRVTLAEIAAVAGVAQPTVSAILNGKTGNNSRFSKTTREKVLAAAQRLRYRPNATARSLMRGRHGTFGVLVTDSSYTYLGALYEAMMRRGEECGYSLHFECVTRAQDAPLPRALREDCVDGLILLVELSDAAAREAEKSGLPCVWLNLNRRAPGGAIVYDEADCMRQAVGHLAAGGCRRVALAGAADGWHYSVRARLEGVREASRLLGLAEPAVFDIRGDGFSPDSRAGVAAGFAHCLRNHPDVDGLVLYSDRMAPAAYAGVALAGRRVPDDLQVIGVNDSLIAAAVSPMLTSMRLRHAEAGTAAVEMILALLNEGRTAAEPVTVGYDLVMRESTRPVSQPGAADGVHLRAMGARTQARTEETDTRYGATVQTEGHDE